MVALESLKNLTPLTSATNWVRCGKPVKPFSASSMDSMAKPAETPSASAAMTLATLCWPLIKSSSVFNNASLPWQIQSCPSMFLKPKSVALAGSFKVKPITLAETGMDETTASSRLTTLFCALSKILAFALAYSFSDA